MKRFFISIAVAIIAALPGSAQKRVFCEIVGTQSILTMKVVIDIDFGQQSKSAADHRLTDENGKSLKFNSMIDALNYMGELGWEFEQAFAITHANSNVYHYLLSREIGEDEDNVPMFNTKGSVREQKKKKSKDTAEAEEFSSEE